uniref:Uncharacterized protein n=1 Tax=Lepeophtheirus salmonis TaxID=72036 RepID=A0A0K2UH73_LEPSM
MRMGSSSLKGTSKEKLAQEEDMDENTEPIVTLLLLLLKFLLLL